MFKFSATILCVFLIAAQSFSKCWLIAGFSMRQAYIARNLCVNRLDPISCCKGSCYLKKTLADDEEKKSAPVKGGLQDEIVLQLEPMVNLLPDPALANNVLAHSTRYIGMGTQEYLPSFFAPPQLG